MNGAPGRDEPEKDRDAGEGEGGVIPLRPASQPPMRLRGSVPRLDRRIEFERRVVRILR